MEKFLSIVYEYKSTRNACKYVLDNSKSNEAPYHNFYHVMTVTKGCGEGSTYLEFDVNDREEVILSALFHDFDHSAGASKDPINIRNAITGFKLWADMHSEFAFNRESVIDIIKATEFPYTIPTEELNIKQKLIRDSDMTQILQENYPQQIFFGLGKEMKKNFNEMLDGQEAFLKSIKPATKWFEEIWNDKQNKVFFELMQWKNLKLK